MKLFLKYFFIAIFILPVSEIYAQNNLSQTLSNLSSDAASAYLGPAVSGFGADINSNWFHEIVKPKLVGFDLELSFVGMGTFFNNNDKTFSSTGKFRFNRDQANTLTSSITNQDDRTGIINQIITQDFQVGISGPTVVGSKNQDVIITFPGKTFTYNTQPFTVPQQSISLAVNGYLNNLPILPVAVPQLSIGTLVGTSVTLRYLPSMKLNSDLDNITYYGIGIQHNPALWLNVPMPVDLSLGLVAQTLTVGSVLKATGESLSLNVGKTFGFGLFSISPYANIAVEKSTIKVNYSETFNTVVGFETDNISFDEDGANTVELVLGTNLRLGIVNINVDYSISQFNTLSAGLGFVIF
ncbi:MAG: DUF6588 family protein [Ignavibacteriaceae bacterium]|jgi:hypothetical protein